MADSAAPRTLTEIRPQWLTEILRRHGCVADGRITSFDMHPIGAEVGFLDGLARLRLTYDRREAGSPASVIVKLPAVEERYRQIGNFYHAYEREIYFYRDLAPRSPLRVPLCYGAEIDRDADLYWLVLEDMSHLLPGDQVKGLTAAQALAAVETIGRFHAAWWDIAELKSLEWMPRRNLHPPRYRAAWPRFKDAIGAHLPQAALKLGEHLYENLDVFLDRLDTLPMTIVHSDFRADNLLLEDLAAAQPIVVLDWQLAIRSAGILDVARLLCGSVSTADRAAIAREALHRWHGTLVAGGVRDYPLAQALDDYKTCLLVSLYYPVTIHEAEEAAGTRGTALAHAQIERFFNAALELNADAFR